MNNSSVEFIDTSKECVNMMKKLTKEAMKQGGKLVVDILKEKIPVRSGISKKSAKAWAKIDYKTGQPYLEVGYLSRSQMKKKYNIKYFVNPSWIEFGTRPHTIMTKQLKSGSKYLTYELEGNGHKYGYQVSHPGRSGKNLLRNTAYENVDKIQDIIQEGLVKLKEYTMTKGMNIDLGGDEEID